MADAICDATDDVAGEPDMVWICEQPAGHRGDHGDAEHSWPFNRCPACQAEVFDSHECTRRYKVVEAGLVGSYTTRCQISDERLIVTGYGRSESSGIGMVMSLKSPVVEDWYLNQPHT